MSKQAFLQEVNNPHDLPDGTVSYKDFMGNRNNRFTNPEAAQKNRIQSPSKVLHFFNAPPSMAEDEIIEVNMKKIVFVSILSSLVPCTTVIPSYTVPGYTAKLAYRLLARLLMKGSRFLLPLHP